MRSNHDRGRWRVVRGLVILMVGTVLALGVTGCPPEEEETGSAPPAQGRDVAEDVAAGQTKITILSDGSGGCKIADVQENTAATVPRGHWAVWENQTELEISLSFGRVKRLFGVFEAVVYPHDELRLEIRKDADISAHEYTYRCGSTTTPGAKIIVPPPPPTGDDG